MGRSLAAQRGNFMFASQETPRDDGSFDVDSILRLAPPVLKVVTGKIEEGTAGAPAEPKGKSRTQQKASASKPKSVAEMSDQDIRRQVVERLGTTASLYSVQVSDGVVQISGEVGTDYEGSYIVGIIQMVAGVKMVRADFRRREANAERQARFNWPAIPQINGRTAIAIVFGAVSLFSGWWYQTLRSAAVVEEVGPIAFEVQIAANGSTLPGAILTAIPLQKVNDPSRKLMNAVCPRGVVNDDGKVVWTTHQLGDGIPPGQYVVTITWRPLLKQDDEFLPGPNRVPVLYSEARTTPLRLRVDPKEKLAVTLEIENVLSGPQ